MTEFTINGYIGTENISTKELEAGVICLLFYDNHLSIHTLEHVNSEGYWVTDLGAEIIPEQRLMKFITVHENTLYPIAIKDWPDIIKHRLNLKASLTFIIKPHRFKPGHSLQICSKCDASFVANSNQPYCEKCCQALSVAYLKDKYKVNKPTEKMFKHSIVKDLLKEAYEMGWIKGWAKIKDEDSFYKWINDKLK